MSEETDASEPRNRPAEGAAAHRAERHRPALPVAIRIILFVVGWSLLLIGVAGLVLPGIQGILTILLGAAVLSVASETVYRLLRKTLRPRWPGLWSKIRGLRQRVHDRFSRHPTESGRDADTGEPPGPAGGSGAD
jgi:hypothetical protein